MVPEITFNSYLTRDAYNILIDKVNNDTTNLEAENARQIKMARENKDKQDATLQKIKDIDNQISKLNPNNASDKQKIESLQRDRAKLKSQNDLERVQTETSKFTSQISEYLMLTGAQFAQPVDMKNSKEVSKLMAQLSSNQENLIMSRDARLSQLSDIENTDTKTIEQLAVYGASMIELDKIRLTNASARQVTVGATYNTKIQTSVINPDAQLQISNGSEIKQMLLNKINDIEVKSRVLDSNDTYFVKLTNEIMDARDKINNNNSYK